MLCIILGVIGFYFIFGGPLDRMLGYDDKPSKSSKAEQSSGGL